MVGILNILTILLDPINISNFEYSWGQHSPEIIPNGNLLQFDNGFGREFGNAEVDYSRIVEYEINVNSNNIGGTVAQIWQYGKERDDMFSPFISDVDYIQDTSTKLIVAGATAYDMEYIDNITQLFTANPLEVETRIIEVNNYSEIIFEMTLSSGIHTGTTYRAEKIILD